MNLHKETCGIFRTDRHFVTPKSEGWISSMISLLLLEKSKSTDSDLIKSLNQETRTGNILAGIINEIGRYVCKVKILDYRKLNILYKTDEIRYKRYIYFGFG